MVADIMGFDVANKLQRERLKQQSDHGERVIYWQLHVATLTPPISMSEAFSSFDM